MSMSAWTAGRLLKSAVVFLMQTNLPIVNDVKVQTHIDCFQLFTRNLPAVQYLLQVDMAAVVVAAAVPAVPVITNQRKIRSISWQKKKLSS